MTLSRVTFTFTCVLFCYVSGLYTNDLEDGKEVPVFRYDYTYVMEADGYFKVHDVPVRWEAARRLCRLEGAELASPLNKDVTAVMTSFMKKHKFQEIHTGFSSRFLTGHFMSIKGVRLDDVPHTWSETGTYESRYTVAMNSNTGLSLSRLNYELPFICYKEKPADLVSNVCGTSDPGYRFRKQDQADSSRCYKFHHIPLSWDDAAATCFAEGGHLAIINSDQEATLLKNMFNEYHGQIFGKGYKNAIHVGFREDMETGEWRTIFDESLDEAGYAKWDPNQPDNYMGVQDCGNMFRSGLLDDDNCKDKHAFICELPVQNHVTHDMEFFNFFSTTSALS